MASATIGNPSSIIRADVATSAADATIVHTESYDHPPVTRRRAHRLEPAPRSRQVQRQRTFRCRALSKVATVACRRSIGRMHRASVLLQATQTSRIHRDANEPATASQMWLRLRSQSRPAARGGERAVRQRSGLPRRPSTRRANLSARRERCSAANTPCSRNRRTASPL
jgi:hypothetical protein